MGGENEEVGVDEGLPFFFSLELADKQDVVLQVVLRDEVIDQREVIRLTGTGDGKDGVGEFFDNGSPGGEETIKPFFGVES